MVRLPDNAYQDLQVYYGDLHNHCDLSYGHGSLTDALHNARLQLDFASVTVHAAWHDIPTDDPALGYLIDYHREGFASAQAQWADYLAAIEERNAAGRFVTFPSFEWHSREFGDYCVYYPNTQQAPLFDAPDLPTLREHLRALDAPALLIPHHIGYKQGSRGINWLAFEPELSPVAEIFSFHGSSESSEGPYPYLHSMGPRHEHSSAQYGWAAEHIFGVIGSTDHHNAVPGSYGYGRLGVWAQSLTRAAIWDALQNRRTYALTGDRIQLEFVLNGMPMGAVCPPNRDRRIAVAVNGGDSIDYIDVLHNNRVIHRENVLPANTNANTFKVYVEMGWSERTKPFDWDVILDIDGGQLQGVEPRLRGPRPTVVPPDNTFAYTQLAYAGDNRVHLQTRTYPNPSLHTAATEGLALEITGTNETTLLATINGEQQHIALGELRSGARTFYTGGFVSPAIAFHRAVPLSEYTHHFTFDHHHQTSQRDWYYVRLRQRNNQWAWSSPIWINGMTST